MTDADYLLRLALTLAGIGIFAFVVNIIIQYRNHRRFPYARRIHRKR